MARVELIKSGWHSHTSGFYRRLNQNINVGRRSLVTMSVKRATTDQQLIDTVRIKRGHQGF